MNKSVKVIGEPVQRPTAAAVATRLVENQIERHPLVALAAHYAGVLLGLFRRPPAPKRLDPAPSRLPAAPNRVRAASKRLGAAPKRLRAARGCGATASAVAFVSASGGKEVRHG
jgi:hypothetical protein